jgi:hypothetical protein
LSGVDRQLDRPPSIVDEEGATNEIPFPSFLMLSTRFALIKHPAWLSLKYSVFRLIHIIPTCNRGRGHWLCHSETTGQYPLLYSKQ